MQSSSSNSSSELAFSAVDENKIKICFVMIDGIGEVNIAELDGKTALQSASTPNLDRLAGRFLFIEEFV